jgi:glycosyltransferase involved in cell wall biosynthesis
VAVKVTLVPEQMLLSASLEAIITDGVTGFLAEPNHPQSLAMKIETALQSGDKIADITQAARQKIEQDFNIETTSQRLLALITATKNL